MGTFKEPQPRKVSIQEKQEASQRNFPNPSPAEQSLLDQTQPPFQTGPSSLDVTIRTAALQAATTLYAGTTDLTTFWPNVGSFEDYLRNGPTP